MRKISFLIFTMLLSVLFVGKVSAATKITIEGEDNIEDNVLVVNISAEGSNMLDVVGTLEYDTSELTLLSADGLNGFTVTSGEKLLAERNTPISEKTQFVKLKFKIKNPTTQEKKFVIKYKDLEISTLTITQTGTSITNDETLSSAASEITIKARENVTDPVDPVNKPIIEKTPETGDIPIYVFLALIVVSGAVFLKRKYS